MMATKESSIINGDSPLPIPRQFARWLGWNEAGILQQLHYHTEQEHGQDLDGLRWIRMSETDWMEEIPLDEKAIQRAIVNLVSDGLIVSRTFKGRCKWYAILYSAVGDLAGPVDRITQKSAKRKKASASRKEFTPKEHFVPIVINSIDEGSSGDYANAKEQSVPILKEQNGPMHRNKMGPVWEQNGVLQESLQESRQDSSTNVEGDKSPPAEKVKAESIPKRSRPEPVPAAKVFVEVTGKHVLNNTQIQEIDKRVGRDPPALERWRETVTAWQLAGNKINNVSGMLDWFKKGIPVYAQKASTNGTHQRNNREQRTGQELKSKPTYNPATDEIIPAGPGRRLP